MLTIKSFGNYFLSIFTKKQIMSRVITKVPRRLIFEESIEFVKKIKSLSLAEEFVFDFSDLYQIDPLSLLYVSSEIKNCRDYFSDSEFKLINYKGSNCSYMAHMGFFQAFGADYGNYPGEAGGNQKYLPINIINIPAIKDEAAELMINPAELMESRCRELATILTQDSNQGLIDVLTYCLREIFRNAIEHSEAYQFGYCAQYLPSKSEVSLAIIDRGIGLKDSLSQNPRLEIRNDLDAIGLSLMPGISGKVYPGQKRKQKGEWANSGYGLYMTSNICKNGGNFFIASGESGLLITDKITREMDTPVKGTALNLTINTKRLGSLKEMLKEIRDQIPTTTTTTTVPSPSTMGLKKSQSE